MAEMKQDKKLKMVSELCDRLLLLSSIFNPTVLLRIESRMMDMRSLICGLFML